MRTRNRLKGLLLAMAFLALAAGGCATNPVTGKSELSMVSEQQEIAIGQENYPLMTQQSEGETGHAEIQRLVSEVGRKMAATSERPQLPWEFNVVDDNTPNAYALPGGKISITRGLITLFETEDQLAGVIGHEIGHATARHYNAQASRGQIAQILVGAATIGAGAMDVDPNLVAAGAGVGAQLVLTKYSRDQERQSDELGMKYMTAAGYNPKGFAESMEILKTTHDREPDALSQLFASHPVTGERITTARERLSQQYAQYTSRPEKTSEFQRAIAPLRKEAPAFKIADEGKALLAQKKVREADAKFSQAAQMAPDAAILHVYHAQTRWNLQDAAGAERAAARAVQANPNLFYGRLYRGVALLKLKRPQEALPELDAADKLVPQQLVVAFLRGRAYEDMGRREEAARLYNAVAQATQGQGQYGQYAVQRLREWGYIS
jgi:predicted Zn-dependent protease